MPDPLARPAVGDLTLRLFDRGVHPELFEPLVTRRVTRGGYALTAHLLAGGHVLEFRRGATTVTEAVAPEANPLPRSGLRLARRFAGHQRGKLTFAGGERYEVGLDAETLAPELFAHVHAELSHDAAKRGLAFHFPPHRRLGLAPLSYLTAEAIPAGLSVQAFHTFPDEFIVVKTQSLIEFREGAT